MIFLEWQGMEGGRVRGSKQNIFLKSPALCFKGFSSARIDIICAVKSPKDKKKMLPQAQAQILAVLF